MIDNMSTTSGENNSQAVRFSSEQRNEIMLDNLHFRSISIAELERKQKRSVMEMLQDSSIDNLAMVISKGLNNCDQNTSFEAIDEWREVAKKDTFELLVYIIDTLDNQGFLPKALKLKEKIQARIEKVSKMSEEDVSAL